MPDRRSLTAAVLTLCLAIPIGASAEGFDDMYVIGDSVSDQGNLFEAKEILRGLGVPWEEQYYNGRFSNGEVAVGVIAERIGISLEPSIDGGNNFANGGARTDYNIVEKDETKPFPVSLLDHNPGPETGEEEDAFPWTLITQAESLEDRGINNPDALYVVFASANDMVDLTVIETLIDLGIFPPPSPGFPHDKEAFIQKVILDGIINAIEACKEAGARHVLVPNTPNLGIVPRIVKNPTLNSQGVFSDNATSISCAYNVALERKLAEWENEPGNEDVNIIRFDFYSFLGCVVNNPTIFGFTNSTEPCYTGFVDPLPPDQFTVCDNPDDYVFWDNEHPTETFHALMAEWMIRAVVDDILGDLIQRVDNLDIDEETKNSLNDKLNSAKDKLANHETDDVSDKLEDFIEVVEEEISGDDADALIDGTEKILSLLDD